MALVEQFRRVYALKAPDVEEWIDVTFHRPLAALIALVLLPTPIGPNLVTFGSLIAGLAGSVAFGWSMWSGNPDGRWIAGLLVFGSVILDCADGQLARAKGGGSRWGRILDGIVDLVVLLTLYVLIFFDMLRLHGWIWATVAFVGGMSGGLRIYLYDKFKSIYLSYVDPSASDGGEPVQVVFRQWEKVKAEGTLPQKIAMFVYAGMLLKAQEAIVPGPSEPPVVTGESAARFRARHLPKMRVATLLGLGTHMLFVYTAVTLSAWFDNALPALQVLFFGPYNLLLVALLIWTRSMRE